MVNIGTRNKKEKGKKCGIVAESLTKRYGDTVAVDTINLCVPYGSIYGLLGPNGAGKTTTLRMLTTLCRPTDGHATVGGVSIQNRERLVGNIGFMPEEPPIYEELTGREQLQYLQSLRGISPQGPGTDVDYLFEQLELASAADERIGTYSKGMRQKLSFVAAIFHDPSVVLLDEPTAGLDPRSRRRIIGIIERLADEGTAVFLSTHDLAVVEETADSVGILHHGQLLAEGSPEELLRRADSGGELEDVFLEVTSGEFER